MQPAGQAADGGEQSRGLVEGHGLAVPARQEVAAAGVSITAIEFFPVVVILGMLATLRTRYTLVAKVPVIPGSSGGPAGLKA